MDAASTLRRARLSAGLTLRALAERAGTSHATLAAYEAGWTTPRVDTLDRILRAAGYASDLTTSVRPDAPTSSASPKVGSCYRSWTWPPSSPPATTA